jgi:outer membrane protein assembly factor BamB
MKAWIFAAALFGAALPAAAAPADGGEAVVLRRYPAPEARQGVAVDRDHVYAVANWVIAKYDKKTGAKLTEWRGDPVRFPHINSCTVIARELVCASSNFPAVPHWSAVEIFDPVSLRHLRTVPLGPGTGSITWVERRDGAWWAAFANYDEKGGEAPRDHRHTTLVRFDDQWRRTGAWMFPTTVLERFKPTSSSGGGFGPDGRLYVTGHDHTELYVLDLPEAGGPVLDHIATIKVQVEGQAIDWDESQPGVLYGISRPGRQIVAMRIPGVGAK